MTHPLNSLNTINWAAVQHARGSADDVPQMLQDLLSTDSQLRGAAVSKLFDSICHQGTIYEATVHVVPFLIELLSSPATPDREAVACLVGSIAAGVGYLEVHCITAEDHATWREILRKQGQRLEDELAREQSITRQVRLAAQPTLPLLVPYLTNSLPEVRMIAIEAFAAYPELRATYLPALRAALEVETDEEVEECLRECISILG